MVSIAFASGTSFGVLGCDYAGVVKEIGVDVPARLRSIGERVGGFVHASECVLVPRNDLELTIPVPSSSALPKCLRSVKSLGADEVFDYNDPDVGKKIKEATGGTLKHAIDRIVEAAKGTPDIISAALSDEGGHIAIILRYGSLRPGVTTQMTLAYKLLGRSFEFPGQRMPTEETTKRGKDFAKLITDILATGKVKPNPLLVMPKGLASVSDGLSQGQKITHRIFDAL
ncbi:hypothetical protein EWM64_g4919 [Hericium alpestre]|uniref:Alcohol dehydrogenase-like C-terminal domain-containing protein n=1 Tax=Hericium alpestre TaxID=135208 RepID=A0A4Y9ZYR4_9AGAM|nr:hypothetical protein EWM64_g4919 [Hericium alpestre]